MILADTSIWIDHFRFGIPDLVAALESNLIVVHPSVDGELACGNLPDRVETLRLLDQLPRSPVASDSEVRHLIEERGLFGSGLGWVDMQLIASVQLLPAGELWTRDRKLKEVWRAI